MECKCSLNNNYEIIGLCDIKDFNQKTRRFLDKSWSQTTISEKLVIPYDKPAVKNILKIYLDINITSTKRVKSPSSNSKSIEGLRLLGNLLLVSGEIHQNIIYTSDTASNSMHSFKFETLFSSYIVLDENLDLEYDSFTVYPCVENLFLEQLDERTLSKSINLFLFAHKIEIPLAINNEFVFYQYDDQNPPRVEIVRVSFDGDKKFLIASSSGIPYVSPREDFFLKFELKDGTTKERKVIGTVPQNQNGTEFVRNLNNQEFKVGDLIAIAYQRSENTFLNNYPNIGENMSMNFVSNRHFNITKTGIEPCLLPNILVVKSTNDESVFNLGFSTELNVILVKLPTSAVTNPTFRGQEYFTITLKSSASVQKVTASLQGNQDGIPVRVFANQPFEYGDIIELTYKEGEKVEILDNPYPTSSRTNLAGTTSKTFRITQSGLVQI